MKERMMNTENNQKIKKIIERKRRKLRNKFNKES